MKEIVLPRAGDVDQRISKFLMCDLTEFITVLQDYLVYGFPVKCKMLVSLSYLLLDHLQFFEKVISRL